MTTAEQVIAYVQGKLHDGPCPGKGALGELCFLQSVAIPGIEGYTLHDTHMAVWRDSVTSTQVAEWFKAAGASRVHIAAWLHCDDNDMREGRSTLDNTRAWDIAFWLPSVTPPAAQHAASEVPA